jgi:single-strand DNA-binding protein
MKQNYVQIIGNLGSTPELKEGDKFTMCKLAIAVNNGYSKDGKWVEKDPTWLHATLWGDRAKLAANNLKKGDKVCIWGRITTNEYTDKKGINRLDYEIMAEGFYQLVRYTKEDELPY